MVKAPERIWAEDFWSKVDRIVDGCWIWTGTKMGRGYGSFRFNGRPTGAHRISWMLANGKLPSSSKVIMHSCDNPACVNPGHLSEGTQSQNVRDCVTKGRHVPFRPPPKEYCRRGHPYTPENTQWVMSRGNKTRRCAICQRENHKRWEARNAGK